MDEKQLNDAFEYLRMPLFEEEAKRLGIPFSYLSKSNDELKAEIILGGEEAFIKNYATEALNLTYDYVVKKKIDSPLKILYFHAFFVLESGGHRPFCTFVNPNKLHLINDSKLIQTFKLKCDAFATYFIKLWNIKSFGRTNYFSMLDGPDVFDSKTYVNVQYPFNIMDDDNIIGNNWDMETYFLILIKMWEYLKPYDFSPIEARIIIEHLP